MAGLYIICGIIISQVTPIVCQNITDAKNLHTKLFVTEAYNKKIRPIIDQTDTLEVHVHFNLNAINGLDEVNEVLKTTGYLSVFWTDDLLNWNPASYGGLETSIWPQDDVWKPDITLANTYKDNKELGTTSLNVNVIHDGSVGWYPFEVYESTCSVDIRYFPFDVQTCSLNFMAWSYNRAEVNLTSRGKGLLFDRYEQNPTWDIIDTHWSVSEDSVEAEISFSITMKRKPLFFSISVILPITLLAVLDIFVFVLPCESGERAGYAVTVFLALAVFLTIVSSTLPANSETMSIFSIYLIIQTVQSTVITLVALVTLRIDSLQEGTPIPCCIVAIFKAKNSLMCNKRRRNNKILDSIDNRNPADISDIISISATQAGESRNIDSEPIDEVHPKFTWKHVLNLLDILCLIFFSSVFLISTATCFIVSTMAGM